MTRLQAKSSRKFLCGAAHEHINFFNERSIMFLAKILDAEFEFEVNEIATPDGNRARVIQCLLFART